MLALVCQGCAVADLQSSSTLASADVSTAKLPKMRKQASTPPAEVDVLDALNGLFAPVGAMETICAASDIMDVEEFAGAPEVAKDRAAVWQKSTLRLRITHKKLADEIFADIAQNRRGAANFQLNGFASYAGKDAGICSGVLVGGNIALTAGHCVLRQHWENQGNEFPSYDLNGEKVYLTASEFARLLVVDFNRQLDIGPIADNSLAAYPDRPYLTFTVRAMIAPKGEPDADLDYAIFRIAGSPEQIGDLALGPDKVSYGAVKTGAPLVVIQHPDGLYKKIAVGAAGDTLSGRLLHSASTDGGSSGSAVLDKNGRIVAVHTEGGCQPFASETWNGALPLARIRKDLAAALAGRR